MNIDEIKDKFKQEGFIHVYEWTDEPNHTYEEHSHKGRVSFFVVKGNIKVRINGTETIVQPGQRLDVPVGVNHSAMVGDQGCKFVVAEEIEGDS